jgi:hypothetical protein
MEAGTVIPGKIARFLEQHANVAAAGTRDEKLVPHVHRVSGWRLEPDQKTLSVMIAESFAEHLRESLEDNGQFSFTVEAFPSHETYQFKGRSRQVRPASEGDNDVVRRVRDRWLRDTRTFFGPDSDVFLGGFVLNPDLTVEFEVQEIYLQTPGPGAGGRLYPAPDTWPGA